MSCGWASDAKGKRSASVGSQTTHRRTMSVPTPYQKTSRRSRSAAAASKPKNFTPQILSALCHGLISAFGPILLVVLFGTSISVLLKGLLQLGVPQQILQTIPAILLGALQFGVPLAISKLSQDAVVQANARAAMNYCITAVLLAIAFPFLALGAESC